MRSLCRLSVVFVASLPAIALFCCTGVRAQTAAAPSTQPAPPHNAAPFVAQLPPLFSAGPSSAPQLPGPATTFHLPPLSPGSNQSLKALNAQKLALLSRNEGPCYTLRTYGFTAGHDPAEAPRLSSSTTCTPASQSHAMAIVVSPPSH